MVALDCEWLHGVKVGRQQQWPDERELPAAIFGSGSPRDEHELPSWGLGVPSGELILPMMARHHPETTKEESKQLGPVIPVMNSGLRRQQPA